MFKNKQMDDLAVGFQNLTPHFRKMAEKDLEFACFMIEEVAEAMNLSEIDEKYKEDVDLCVQELRECLGDSRFSEYFKELF
ncbi:MAG: hypothetical protein RR538_04705 [Erysipelotrichaceae bacterium]